MPLLKTHPASPAEARALRAGNRGFTIVEVMAAAFVLVFAIATSLTALTFGMRAVDTARNTSLAAQIMQSELENIRLLNWAQLSAKPDSENLSIEAIVSLGTNPPLNASLKESLQKMIGKFTAVRTISDVSGKVGEMKNITITISWAGQDGRPHSVSYETKYTKNGLYDFYYTTS